MREPVLSELVVGATSRRGLIARLGRLLVAVGGSGAVAAALRAQAAEAYHFCGHVYTTGSCPPPTRLPPGDPKGAPPRAAGGSPLHDPRPPDGPPRRPGGAEGAR